ncbi:MAG TPA: DMT family transporter [Oligoflexus sp.]|uniref:DMT family transporter n=1 Tax=Oligoflexus sp. TaxID=1971216 RepID=UPI002D234CE2|nr:DMT family transporter [Oligoflexus sp.]HYX31682.1 DMT family transporter [Oligoflexus sp.]
MLHPKRRLGIQQVIASGLCFGCLGILGKLLYQHGATAGELLALRFSFAALMLFAWHMIRGPKRLLISWPQLLSCAVLGIFGYALFAWCFFAALGGLSASLSVLLLYTYPVMVTIGGRLLFQETIPIQKLWALPLVVAGTVALVWGEFSVDKASALILGLCAALFYSLYILLSSRLLRKVPADISVPYIQTFAAMILTGIFVHDVERIQNLWWNAWWIILLIALVGTVLAMSLFLAGLQKLQNWEVALLSTTEPLSAVILAAMFLGERLSASQMLGALGILLGLLVVARPMPRQVPAAEIS